MKPHKQDTENRQAIRLYLSPLSRKHSLHASRFTFCSPCSTETFLEGTLDGDDACPPILRPKGNGLRSRQASEEKLLCRLAQYLMMFRTRPEPPVNLSLPDMSLPAHHRRKRERDSSGLREALDGSFVIGIFSNASLTCGSSFLANLRVSTPVETWLMHLFGEPFGILLKTCYTSPIKLEKESQGNAHNPLTSIASWA